MRTNLIAAATLALAALSVAATPVMAQPHHHRVWVCERNHANTTGGTVLGAVGGGLVGNALSHGGGRTGGTLIGAGVGAVAGHQIAKHNAGKHCHWEYRD